MIPLTDSSGRDETDLRAETRQLIDADVCRIVGEEFARAEALLASHREISAIEYAYARVGIGHRAMVAMLVLTLLGSFINVPLWRVQSTEVTELQDVRIVGVRWIVPVVEQRGRTVIAANVGGAVTPVLLSARTLWPGSL